MRPRRRRDPAALGSVVSQVLGELGLEEARASLRIHERWEEAVGPEVARHCQPVSMRGGVLEAETDTSVWCQQLQLQRPIILEALRRLHGDDAPRELRLRVGVLRR